MVNNFTASSGVGRVDNNYIDYITNKTDSKNEIKNMNLDEETIMDNIEEHDRYWDLQIEIHGDYSFSKNTSYILYKIVKLKIVIEKEFTNKRGTHEEAIIREKLHKLENEYALYGRS